MVNLYSMKSGSLYKQFVIGLLIGAFGISVFGAYVFVRAQIAPGTITNPLFGPAVNDVSRPGIRCSWAGTRNQDLGCDDSGAVKGCVNFSVTCANGVVTAINTGVGGQAQGGGSVDCVPPATACGQ